MGIHKYIESPELMWKLFINYKKETNTNPLTQKDWVGKDATVVQREFTKALTMEGFECYVMDHTRITYPDLTNYFENKNDSYSDFIPICSRIRREIRRDQIEKGLAGLINPSITQRLNGLVDKKQTDIKGSLNVPNLPDIGNRE
tara:strand:+ start:1260 stop:1691 length:432 start_codon:yes stop_codon:yes gene_type:complete